MASATRTVQKLRSVLAGAEYNIAVRYTISQSPRSIAAPNLPFGIHHNLSNNYYVERDGRRAHVPPTLVKPTVLQIAEKDAGSAVSSTGFKPTTPGQIFQCSSW